MNSAKLRAMKSIGRTIRESNEKVLHDAVAQSQHENAVLMAGLREGLKIIEQSNMKIAQLESDVAFLEKEYKSAKALLAENRKANRARIRASQHRD